MKKMFTAILLMATFSFAVVSCGEKKEGEGDKKECKCENDAECKGECKDGCKCGEAKAEADKAEGADAAAVEVKSDNEVIAAIAAVVEKAEAAQSKEEFEALEAEFNALEKKYPDFDPKNLSEAEQEEVNSLIGRLMAAAMKFQ